MIAWYAVRLMRVKPSIFNKTMFGNSVDSIVINQYDGLHAWKALQFFWHRISKGNKPKKASTGAPEVIVWHCQQAPGAGSGGGQGVGSFEETFNMDLDELLEYLERHNAEASAHNDDTDNMASMTGYEIAEDQIQQLMENEALELNIKEVRQMARLPMEYKHRVRLMRLVLGGKSRFQDCILYEPNDTEVGEGNARAAMQSRRLGAIADASVNLLLVDGKLKDTELTLDDKERAGEKKVLEEALQLVKTNSATAPAYSAACATLGVAPADPVIRIADGVELRLKPWQVDGIAYMINQEKGPVGGGILGDGCGLGKTIEGLAFVWLSAGSWGRPISLTGRPWSCVPRGLIDIWLLEIRRRFGAHMVVRVCHRTRMHTSDPMKKELVLDNVEDVRRFVERLPTDDIATARTIILSSYTTWGLRSLVEETNNDDQGANGGRDAKGSKGGKPFGSLTEAEQEAADEEAIQHRVEMDNESEDAAIQVLSDLQDTANGGGLSARRRRRRIKFETRAGGLFARVLCDEGHAVKPIATRAHQSVSKLQVDHVWILTATPMFNGVLDLCGYLASMYRSNWDEMHAVDANNDGVTPYREGKELLQSGGELPVHLLSPTRFARLARGGTLSAADGFDAIPLILKMICLARGTNDSLPGSPDRLIGDDIPPVRVMTVELRYDKNSQKEHDRIYASLSRLLKGPKEDESDPSLGEPSDAEKIDIGILRWLCLLRFTPRLYHFAKSIGKKNSLSKAMADRVSNVLYWARVCKNRWMTVPKSRVDEAWFLCGDCPKLRYLCKILQDEGVWDASREQGELGPRFILFVRWPLVLWYVRMFLDTIGVEVEVIDASMTAEERLVAAANFSNPASSCQILLITFACGGLGLNLHEACSRAVLIESPPNSNMAIQCIGRVHRVGQRHPQKVWVFFQDHTIQRYLEQKNTEKYLPQLSTVWDDKDISQELQAREDARGKEHEGASDADPSQGPEVGFDDEMEEGAASRIRDDMKPVSDLGYGDLEGDKLKQARSNRFLWNAKALKGNPQTPSNIQLKRKYVDCGDVIPAPNDTLRSTRIFHDS